MRYYILPLLIAICTTALCDEYKDEYIELLKEEEYKKLLLHIQKWEEEKPEDPEMFIAYFNYYINRSKKAGVSLDTTPPDQDEKTLVFTDPNTGEVRGYISDRIIFDEEDVRRGTAHLDKGLELHPDRLDMHFGKIHILGEIVDFKSQKEQLITVLKISEQNNNEWLWSDSKKLEDAKNFMMKNIQSRLRTIFELESEEAHNYIKEVSLEMIRIYPNHIYGYNNLGSISCFQKRFDDALNYYKRAEEIDPRDMIVLNNIAQLYRELNDKENAILYYEKMIQCGGERDKAYAEKQIEELQKECLSNGVH